MLWGYCVLLVCTMGYHPILAQDAGGEFSKASFYGAMSGNTEKAIDKQLGLLRQSSLPEKNAYEGALLMKKAGLASGPKKKLSLFKEGHQKLEAVLQADSTNVEWKLLRLMIQEHAPAVLGYKKEMKKDGLYIKTHFKKLPPVAQQAALDYSKASKILKLSDL